MSLLKKPSDKTLLWREFSERVEKHIEEYVVPQYGDVGDDLITTEYSLEECLLNMKRYLARIGKNARPGHDELDLIKIAHYAQMSLAIMEKNNA